VHDITVILLVIIANWFSVLYNTKASCSTVRWLWRNTSAGQSTLVSTIFDDYGLVQGQWRSQEQVCTSWSPMVCLRLKGDLQLVQICYSYLKMSYESGFHNHTVHVLLWDYYFLSTHIITHIFPVYCFSWWFSECLGPFYVAHCISS